jgi:hypothetical protein
MQLEYAYAYLFFFCVLNFMLPAFGPNFAEVARTTEKVEVVGYRHLSALLVTRQYLVILLKR